jgi:heme-degrading monooxygenase HmoA
MILEIAQIDVKPGMETEFESGVKKAAPIFKRAKGCKSMTLQRSHEMLQRYRLFVQWETVENHTKDFRESADFQEWRKLVGIASPRRLMLMLSRCARVLKWEAPQLSPLIPAQAGIQGTIAKPMDFALDPRLRGDERTNCTV